MKTFAGGLYAEFSESEFTELFKDNAIQTGLFSDEVLEVGIKFGFMRRFEKGNTAYVGIDFYRWSRVAVSLRTTITEGFCL